MIKVLVCYKLTFHEYIFLNPSKNILKSSSYVQFCVTLFIKVSSYFSLIKFTYRFKNAKKKIFTFAKIVVGCSKRLLDVK